MIVRVFAFRQAGPTERQPDVGGLRICVSIDERSPARAYSARAGNPLRGSACPYSPPEVMPGERATTATLNGGRSRSFRPPAIWFLQGASPAVLRGRRPSPPSLQPNRWRRHDETAVRMRVSKAHQFAQSEAGSRAPLLSLLLSESASLACC
jgi:hypothetical protein